MRILFADGLSESAIERLRSAGEQCTVKPSLTAENLPDHIAGFDVLIVRSTRVSAETIDAGDQLGLVVRAGAGTNTIDCERAAQLGVFVCNVPGRNAIAVAELALGLMFAVDRHIAAAAADARSGRWNKKAYSKARGLHGATLGIIGMGAIGLEVARRAVACGLKVVTEDKPRSRATQQRMNSIGVRTLPERAAVLACSDIVSLHVPDGPATVGMVDADFLAAMRPDAMLINTARGEVIDEAALLEALDSTDMSAGIDVIADEPAGGSGTIDSALARHPKVTVTHHIGASTHQAQESVADGAVDVIEAYRSGALLNCVNLERAPRRTATLSVRHYDRVGVLAAVLQELRRRELNVATMRNRIFAGSVAAVATIDVAGTIDAELSEALLALPDVIGVSVFGS